MRNGSARLNEKLNGEREDICPWIKARYRVGVSPGGGGQAVDLSVLPLNEDRLLFKRDSMTGRKSKARRRDDTA